MTAPLVSIIIPCYNSAAWIAETLDSALAQTYRPLEIIVFNDGSTDDSPAILARYAAAHPDRIHVASGPNRGLSAARNRGFALSRGEYVLFLDADDLLSPDAITALVEALRGKPNHIATLDWVRFVKTEGEMQVTEIRPRVKTEGDVLRTFLSLWKLPPSSVLWPRQIILNDGEWDESLPHREDNDLYARIFIRGVRAVYASTAKLYYRDTPNSLSKKLTFTSIDSDLRFIAKLENNLRSANRLNDYNDLVAQLYFGIALQLHWLGDEARSHTYYHRAHTLAGLQAFPGSLPARLSYYLLGIKRREQITVLLARLGIGRTSRIAWLRQRSNLHGNQPADIAQP